MDARSSAGEPRVLINREALLHNTRIIRQAVGAHVSVCAVVKADAYGHSAQIVVDTLANFPLDEMASPPVNVLAVATLDEAIALPEHGMPVMILRPIANPRFGRQREQIQHAIQNGWVLTACSPESVEDLGRLAFDLNTRAYVQLMLDTGMSRSGVQPDAFVATMKALTRQPSLRFFGFCTHFACSEDSDNQFTTEQFTRFCELTNAPTGQRRLRGINVVRHAANSGAIFFHPQTHLDMVRPGLALYGIDPRCQYDPELPLRPVMKWVANILLTRDVPAGTGVGYGQTWHAQRESKLAMIPIGYADGYMRNWSNKAVMTVHGKLAPVVGRVSMDMTMIDITDIPDATPGDEVTVMDDDPAAPNSVYELARLGDTIPYELFCRIGSRVHRVPVGEPKLESANL